MNNISIINWNDINELLPSRIGWYLVVLMPKNYTDFTDNKVAMNAWIESFGIEKLWYNNSAFWKDHLEINDRILYWAHLPKVPTF